LRKTALVNKKFAEKAIRPTKRELMGRVTTHARENDASRITHHHERFPLN
jgi:hypothetical protein